MTPTPAPWRERDADRDALLAWNDAARRFVAQLRGLTCHNCGAAGAALVCPRCQLPTCDRCLIGRLDLCAPCVIEAQRASFAEVTT